MIGTGTPGQFIHVVHYLYNAAWALAQYNEKRAELENDAANVEALAENFKKLVLKYNKPVVVCNILMGVVVGTHFSKMWNPKIPELGKENEDKDCWIFHIDNDHSFELHVDALLSGRHDDFVIFDEDSFNDAMVVKYHPETFE